MLALMVTIKIKPGRHAVFLDAMLRDARGSTSDEPECLRFDVLQDATDPNTIFLYEVYRDEAALDAHMQTPHFNMWRTAVQDWFDGDPVVHRCTTVFPGDATWEAVKPRT